MEILLPEISDFSGSKTKIGSKQICEIRLLKANASIWIDVKRIGASAIHKNRAKPQKNLISSDPLSSQVRIDSGCRK
jgi:hypothetical protein